MKAKIIRLAVVLALLVSLFAVAAPPVAAASPETLSPNYGTVTYTTTTPPEIQVGDTIQIIGSGTTDWPLNNVSLQVKWYEADDATKPSVVVDTVPVMPMTGKSSDTDPGSYSLTFKVPPSVAGDHKLRVTDGINNADVAITVVPELKRSPSSGTKGTEVTITANGFSKSTGVIVYDDTDDDGDIATGTLSSKASLVTDSLGTATGTVTGNGDYTFVARDGKGVEFGTAAAPSTLTFTLKAKLTLNPTEGLPDTRVTIKGSQFTTGGAATIDRLAGLSWGGTALNALTPAQQLQTSTGVNFTTDIPIGSTGAFEFHTEAGVTSTVTFKIPVAAVDGLYTVTVTDGTKSASATFNVLARALTLSKTEGPRGVKLLVSGTGMAKGGTIAIGSLVIGSTALNTAVVNIDSAGSFSYEVTIPSTASTGANTIKATDSSGRIAKATYTVVKPTASLSPATQVKGGDVVVVGSGYASNKDGTITGAVKNSPVSFSTDSAGNFQRLVTVATTAGSSNVLTVADSQSNSATVTLKVPSSSLTLSSTSVRPGDVITATGAAFDGNTAVAVAANDPAVTTNLLTTTVYTDSTGNFTTTFVIPNLAEGFAVIYAKAGVTASRSVEVLKKLETTSVALASISDQVTIVWGFDAATQTWMKYDPAAPAVSDLTKLEKGKGYWINVSEAVSLTYGLGTYALSAGWNLIGWLGS